MAVRCIALLALLILPASLSAAQTAARRVSTDDCLGKGLCAYVSPTGRVTCGKCPGQIVKAIRYTKGTTAICTNGRFAREASPARMCRAAGGIAMRVKP